MPFRDKSLTNLRNLADEIERARKAYFDDNQPIMSDNEFDSLVKRYNGFLKREDNDEALVEFDSKIGSKPSGVFAKVNHELPLLSLANAF